MDNNSLGLVIAPPTAFRNRLDCVGDDRLA